jgi:hypothetical protein
MKLLNTTSNLEIEINKKKSELFVLEETLKLENEVRSWIDFEKLHNCLEYLKLGVNKEVSFRLEANEKGIYGQFETCLIPLKGCTIKQLSWKGYDGKGRSKNDEAMKEKAKKLKNKIESMTNLKVNVNYFCFEKDRRNDKSEFSILATFTIE